MQWETGTPSPQADRREHLFQDVRQRSAEFRHERLTQLNDAMLTLLNQLSNLVAAFIAHEIQSPSQLVK